MSTENSVSFEEEIVVEKEITREVDVEVIGNKKEVQVERTVEIERQPETTVEVTREVVQETPPPKQPLPEGVSLDSDASYEYSVEKVVEVDRVVETEVVRNGEVIEKRGEDKKVFLNYRKNRLTTFVKMMEFLKRTESTRFSHQAEMMKRTVRFRQFGEFLRLYLSDENRLKEFTEGKLEKEDVKMAQRMIVDEDILEKMRQFYMVNSWQDKRVKEYADLIQFARGSGDKSPEEEARLVDIMENGLKSHNTVQIGMYGLRTKDETEGLWGVGYVPYEETPLDALDDDTDTARLTELPPLPEDSESEPEGQEKWRESGFFVRNRSRRLAFNDALIVDRSTSEILGADGREEDFDSGKKVDFEYEIFGHLTMDLNQTLLWKKLKMNGDRASNERKIAVRKYLGKKRATKVKDAELSEEAKDFIEKEEELDVLAKGIRKEYDASAGDLSKREEQISEFFKLVSRANNKDLQEGVFVSGVDADEYILRERESERKFSSTTKTTKHMRVMSLIDGVVQETQEIKLEDIESENADYDSMVSPFVQEVFQVGDTYVSLYLMEVLEESPEGRQKALKEIISKGDFVFLKEEYRNLGMTVETDIMDDRIFENDKWLYMVYFKGGYKRLFGLMDSRFSHYRTDLVKIYEPGHTGERYKSNFYNFTSKITERTNESLSSEDPAHKQQLMRWNFETLESQGTDHIEWTRKTRLLHDIRQLSIREVMWSLGYLRSDSSINGKIMPYWPFSPVRKDELNLYLERRPQLKMIMMKPGKEVIARERELSISSTSSHERERVYVKDVKKDVNIEIIEKNKKAPAIRKYSNPSSNSSEPVIARNPNESFDTVPSEVSSTSSAKGSGRMSNAMLITMIVIGSIAVGSILGTTIAVVNLLPPSEVPIQTNTTPETTIDISKRVKPDTPTPMKTIPNKVKPIQSKPTQPLKQKTTIPNPDLKFTKTKAKPMAKEAPIVKSHPPKKIKVVPVTPKKTAAKPSAPKPSAPNQKVILDSHHQSHTFVVEHHYIQPQFVISPPQSNSHPPVININNETSSESAAPAQAPVPVQTVAAPTPSPQVVQQTTQPNPVVVSQQPSGPIHVQPKIEFNPVIQPTINVPVNVQAPTPPAPGKSVNKVINNHKIITNSTQSPPVVNNMEKIIETKGQVEEMKQAHQNQQNMIVSDENEMSDIDALVNDIKMNVSSDQEMNDLKNLIIHRDQSPSQGDRKTADNQPMKIIIKHNHSHGHHHHHHSSGPSFVGILTTTIKRHPSRRGGSHHRSGSSFMGASHSHHRHHKSHHGFISQFRIKSATPPVPPVKIKKSSQGKIKSSDEALSAYLDDYKDTGVAMKQPMAVKPVAVTPVVPAANCSGHAVIPVAMNPNCGKKKHKKKKKRKKRKLRSLKKRHEKVTKSNSNFQDFTEEPLFDNDDFLLDQAESEDLKKSTRQWNHRFNMFQYFDKNKPHRKSESPGTYEDSQGLVSFDFPKMAMDMGMEMGLNDKDIREVTDYVNSSQSLKI